jgi:hypothetical protein
MPSPEFLAEPLDDSSIPPDSRLWRRAFPAQRYWDQQQNKYRPASGAFRDHNPAYPGLSVYIVGETTVEAALQTGPGMDLVEFPAAVARNKKCRILRDEEEEKGHALIFGNGTGGRLTKGQAESIASASEYVVPDTSKLSPP